MNYSCLESVQNLMFYLTACYKKNICCSVQVGCCWGVVFFLPFLLFFYCVILYSPITYIYIFTDDLCILDSTLNKMFKQEIQQIQDLFRLEEGEIRLSINNAGAFYIFVFILSCKSLVHPETSRLYISCNIVYTWKLHYDDRSSGMHAQSMSVHLFVVGQRITLICKMTSEDTAFSLFLHMLNTQDKKCPSDRFRIVGSCIFHL